MVAVVLSLAVLLLVAAVEVLLPLVNEERRENYRI